MKFLDDAQLPLRLLAFLHDHGHNVVHTSALAEGNRSTDRVIAELADAEDRGLEGQRLQGRPPAAVEPAPVAGDRDREYHELSPARSHRREPDAIVTAYDDADFVELGSDSLVVHPRSDAQ